MKYSIKSLLALGMSVLVVGCGEGDKKALTKKTLYATGINPIEVNVSHVIDGDTFVYEVSNHPSEAVTLGCGLMTYNLNTPYGAESKQELERLLPSGSKVTIFPIGVNQKGEIEGLVLNYQDEFINKEVVKAGTAFVDISIPKPRLCEKESKELKYSPSRAMDDGFAEGYRKIDQARKKLPWVVNTKYK